MAWSVKYLKSDSIYNLMNFGTGSKIATKVLYNDAQTSDYITVSEFASLAASLNAWIPIPILEDSNFSYNRTSRQFRYNDANRYQPNKLNGCLVVNAALTATSCVAALKLNDRVSSNLFGYSAASGGNLVQLNTAPYVILQAHDSQQNYSHVLYYCYNSPGGFDIRCRLMNSAGYDEGYTSLYAPGSNISESFISDLIDYDPTGADPYTELIPESTTGGGDGSGDFSDDTIDEPANPTVSALNSGFISAYSPTISELNALASYMWTSDFTTNLNKVFGDNPMGTILGLSAIPVSPTTGSPQSVILGNVDTHIEMPVITSQYVKFNCGSINIQPKYGAFLDYEPYTSIDLFLPYIGLVQLSTNDVMGKSLAVTYTIDVLSGACVANVACGGTIMYTFEGACATQFPVTNNDYSNMFKAAIDAASSIVGAIGGAVASGMTGNVAGAVGAIADGMAGAAQAAMNAHPVVNRSGSLSGSAGLMGIQKPFIVWTTPNMVASNNQNSFIGYPNFITTSLSSLSGYTEIENINLGIAGATNEEVNEIKTLLRNGVIF